MADLPTGANLPHPPPINSTPDDPFTRARLKLDQAVKLLEAGPASEAVKAALESWVQASQVIAARQAQVIAVRTALQQALTAHRDLEARLIEQVTKLS